MNNGYCTDFICTYKLHDDDIKDDMYHAQFLQAFKLNEWNSTKIDNTIQLVFQDIKEELRHVIQYIKHNECNCIPSIRLFFPILDDISIFQLLFVYDFFDLVHNCICEKYNNGFVSIDTINKLFDKIKS
jgi:hypothetical protein